MKKQAMSEPISFFHATARTLVSIVFIASALVICTLRAVTQSTWTHKGIRARYGHSAVFDPSSGKLIVFAGQHTVTFGNMNDTFWGTYIAGSSELTWMPASPTGLPPSSRFGHTAIYDSVNARMVVFGGASGTDVPASCQNDVWLLQNANGLNAAPSWRQQSPSGTAPPPRFAHTAVYDSGSDSMIVFGGYDCTSTYFNDVWVLSNANGLGGTPSWTQLSPVGSAPAGREGATAVYDATDNLMIVFGGDSGTAADNDVWVLCNANGTGGTPAWTQLFPTGTAPAPRSGHSAIYDGVSGRMTIYAGQVSPAVPVAPGALPTTGLLNDFWVLTNANALGGTPAWTQLTPQTPAAFRSFHTAAYDSANDTMLIFGGKTTVGVLPADDHITVMTEANGLQP